MADTTVLQDLADKHGFKRFGVGFIDLRRWMQMFITPEPGLNDDTLRAMGADFPDPSEACKSETLAIVDAAPRLVAGYEGWSIEEARFAAGIELEDDFGAQLAATREPAPAVGTDFARSAPIMAAFGVHVGKLIDILNERALRVRNNPYQCQWYRELNQVANEVTTAAAAIPALVRNLRGAAVIVSNATMERNPPAPPPAQPAQPGGPTTQPSQPQASTGAGMTPTMPQWKVHGLAMVTSADAISLFNLARSCVPELMSFNAPTNGSPTALPEIDGVDFLLSPHVALTTDTLMVTSGDTATNSANSVLEANAPTTTPFMTVVYNLKALADVIADSGAPVPPEVRSLLTGRTELQVEPRDNGVFVRTSLQLTPR